jgi:DNA-binding response OmpR family regulator
MNFSVGKKNHVLVVDDDKSIVELMRDFLEYEGFHVEEALDATEALAILDDVRIDCILLDIMMPGQSGFELCKQIRTKNDVPILFLSAKGDDIDKIRGLGMGADDYIVKSATPAEVVARVKAVLRRYHAPVPTNQEFSTETIIRFGRLEVDILAHEVRLDGKPVSLTPKEFEILCLLAEHPRQVFTYEQLLEYFWENIGDKHTVTVHIGRIREKIEENPNKPAFIVNVWGVGYRFEGEKR